MESKFHTSFSFDKEKSTTKSALSSSYKKFVTLVEFHDAANLFALGQFRV